MTEGPECALMPYAADFCSRTTHRFRDTGVQRSPLIPGVSRKFTIYRLPLHRKVGSLDIDFILGRLVCLMQALHQNNFG